MKQLDMNRGASPLYLQIGQILKEEILNKIYPYQAIIPSEAELQKKYQVSRITARQAIQELEKERLVKRARGKGTIVIYQEKINENLLGIKSFTEEMKEKNITPATSYAHIELVKADKVLAEVFSVPIETDFFRLERVRTGDGEPIVVFVSYFPKECDLALDDSLYFGSIYKMLEQKGLEPVLVNEQFDCMLPDTWLKKQLEIYGTLPIFRRIRKSYTQQGMILEYTISYYRSDRYAYHIELKK